MSNHKVILGITAIILLGVSLYANTESFDAFAEKKIEPKKTDWTKKFKETLKKLPIIEFGKAIPKK